MKKRKRHYQRRTPVAAAGTAPPAAAAVVVPAAPVEPTAATATPGDVPPAAVPPVAADIPPAPPFVEVDAAAGQTAAPTIEPPPIYRATPAAAPPSDELPVEEVLEAEVLDDATAAAASAAPPPPEPEAAPGPADAAPAELPDEDVVAAFSHLMAMLNLGALHFGSHYAFHVDLNPATPADLAAGQRAWKGYATRLAAKMHLTGDFARVAVWNVQHTLSHHPAIAGPPRPAHDPEDEEVIDATATPPGDPAA